MSNTRDFKSLGVWAEDAVTPVPGFPVSGTSYRDETVTETANKLGDAYDTKPDSAVFNQKMFIITSFLDLMDKHGVVGWTDLVDYVVPAIVWGSDNSFYQALQASGPSTAVKDPISEPTYWELVTSATQLRTDLADETPGTEGSRLVGYNKFDVNGGIDDGLTVKEALDEVAENVDNLQGLKIILSGSFDGTTGLVVGSAFNVYQNKAFFEINPENNNIINFLVLLEDDSIIFDMQDAVCFVSTRSIQDPELPAGNFIPLTTSIITRGFSVPPLHNDVKLGIKIWQYEVQTTKDATVLQDFNVMIATVDPVGSGQ